MRTAGSSPSTPPVLVVAEGWVLDGLAESRLRHQLARAEPGVCGVSAQAAALLPGASYRATAARYALERWSAARPAGSGVGGAAVLLREGVQHHLDGDHVVVDAAGGTLLVDPGAHVHDARPRGRGVSELVVADAAARAPFPSRPVVAFLALSPDSARAEWAGALADDLLDHEVDARLVLAVDPGGARLTRPCLADPRSITAIAPDVVVTLDREAAAVVDDWLGDDRLAFVVPVDDRLDRGVELVSWRLGEERGRVRARVGPSVTASELGATVARLCSGPQPLPPRDDPVGASTSDDLRREVSAVITAIRPRRRPAAPLALTLVDGSDDARWSALATHLSAAGQRITRVADPSEALGAAGVVIVPARAVGRGHVAIVEARRAAGDVTVVVVDADDLVAGGDVVDPQVLDLVRAARQVLVPSRWLAELVDDPLVSVLVVPPLVAEAHVAPPADDGRPRDDGVGVVRWQVDDGDPDERAAVAEALGAALEAHPDLAVVLDGPASSQVTFPSRLAARVRRLAGGGVSVNAAPDVLLWTADVTAVSRAGTAGPLVAAALDGRPTLVSSLNPAADLVGLPCELRVAAPAERDAWADALARLLDDGAWRAAQGDVVAARVEALFGDAAASLTVERLLGWLKGRSRA